MFELSKDQIEKAYDWKQSRPIQYAGAINGRFTYCFTPTTLGMIIRLKDDFGPEPKEIDLTEYETW